MEQARVDHSRSQALAPEGHQPAARTRARNVGVSGIAVVYRLLRPLVDIFSRWRWCAAVRARARAVGRGVYVYGPVYFLGGDAVSLGERGNLYDNVMFETRDGAEIVVGDNFTINRGTLISAHVGIRIGKYALIGEFVSIRDNNHAFDDPSRPIREQGYTAAPIRVGDDVWVGRGSVVLAGVTIGDGVVIAANSVVNKDVPAMEVWAGAPARFVRKRGEPSAS